jgi:hypothetical protein
MAKGGSAEKAVREIRRKTRRKFSAEEKVRKGAGFSIRELSPDDPIFTRGFVIGGHYPGRSSRSAGSSSTSRTKRSAVSAKLSPGRSEEENSGS